MYNLKNKSLSKMYRGKNIKNSMDRVDLKTWSTDFMQVF